MSQEARARAAYMRAVGDQVRTHILSLSLSHTHTHVHTYMHTHTHILSLSIYMCVRVCFFVDLSVYLCVSVSVFLCMSACLRVCRFCESKYFCVCLCVCVCLLIHKTSLLTSFGGGVKGSDWKSDKLWNNFIKWEQTRGGVDV